MAPVDRGNAICTRDHVTKLLPGYCHPLPVYRFSTDFDHLGSVVVTTGGRVVELPTTAGCLSVMTVWQKRARTSGGQVTGIARFGKTRPNVTRFDDFAGRSNRLRGARICSFPRVPITIFRAGRLI